jgi:FdhD protein
MISEGLISCPEDIAVLTISEDGHRAEAQISADASAFLRPFPACQTPDPLRIARAMECLYSGDTTHAKTHGTHGCVLSAGDGSVTLFEDIGRYNAADKAIGAAALRCLPMEQCMLLSSGRVPEGMILKMVRSRVPTLVSKAVATVSAVETARAYNVTLCFSARDDGYSCHPEQAALSGGADTK